MNPPDDSHHHQSPIGRSDTDGSTMGNAVSWLPRARRRRDITPPSGFRPLPLREFVVKVYERCNLACDYCYLYEMADQTWKDRPVRMSREVFTQLSFRIAEHVRQHDLTSIDVVLHGGEPLVQNAAFFRFVAERLRADLPNGVDVRYRLQTNGILLTAELLDLFLELGITVGVSLDGGREEQDRHRRYRNGRSSYDEVVRGIELLALPRYRPLFSRLYATIDLANDPIATYDHLAAFDPPFVDFLLPHGNWDEAPPGLEPRALSGPPDRVGSPDMGSSYADWLIAVFDHWYPAVPARPAVRLLSEIVGLVLGSASRLESIGLSPSALVSVETDGAMEQLDTLRSTYHGATRTGHDVWHNSFDDVLRHPEILRRQIGEEALCSTCRSCAIHETCGGGYLPHRYARQNGLDNPSVYCDDLARLIRHIEQAVLHDVLHGVE